MALKKRPRQGHDAVVPETKNIPDSEPQPGPSSLKVAKKRRLSSKPEWDKHHVFQVALETDIARWVVEDMQQFSMIDTEAYKRKMKAATQG